MAKTLFLLRHAESGEKKAGQTDRDRELTTTGMREAFQLGSHLRQEKVSIDVIFTSNAQRAKATTQLVADALKMDQDRIVVDDELYDASPRTFLDLIRGFDNNIRTALCVAHNPTISYLAEYLTKVEKLSNMPPCGMAVIRFEVANWTAVDEATGQLIDFLKPSTFNQ